MDSKDEYNASKGDIGDSTLSSNITAPEALVESADLEQNLEDNSAVSQNHPLNTLSAQKFVDEPSLRKINNEEGLSVGDEKLSMVEPRNNEAENSAVPATVQPGVSGMVQPEINDSAVPDKIQPEIGGNGEDNQRKAFFYISSSELKNSSESQSVSGVSREPSETSNRRNVRQERREPRRCLGSQQSHYIVVTVALMTALLGSIMYHVSRSGPEILKFLEKSPMGTKTIAASAILISIVVLIFSSLCMSYLSNYPPLASLVPNYEQLGNVDSVMAMNRASNPQYLYEEGHSSDATEHRFSQSQSADILDRRIYRKHTDESRIVLKRFKAKTGTDAKVIPLTELHPEVSTSNQATIPSETVKENYGDISSAETSTDAQLTNLRVIVDEISDDVKNGNLRQGLDTPVEVPSNSQSNDDVKESDI